jgi:hypothetical protein
MYVTENVKQRRHNSSNEGCDRRVETGKVVSRVPCGMRYATQAVRSKLSLMHAVSGVRSSV